MEIRVAILELFPTATHKLLHPGAENAKSCLWNEINDPITFKTILVSSKMIRRQGFLDQFHVIIIPGGSSGHQAKHLGREGMENIRKFVYEGGGYVGICAGAYLALSDYEPARSLKLMKAGALLDWQRGHLRVPISFYPQSTFLLQTQYTDECCMDSLGGQTIKLAVSQDKLNKSNAKDGCSSSSDDCVDDQRASNEERCSVYGLEDSMMQEVIARFNNGPCMVDVCIDDREPNCDDAEYPPGEPTWLAAYKQGIRSNRECKGTGPRVKAAEEKHVTKHIPAGPEGVDVGTYAAGWCAFGVGRVLLLSPHFESTPLDETSLSKTSCGDKELKKIVRRAVLWCALPKANG